MKSKKFWKNSFLYILLFFCLSYILFSFHYQPVGWDSAVYVGMGKFIFSAGNTGVFEPMRPLLLPFLFGALWKAGLSPILFGMVLEFLFALGAIFLAYLITKQAFGRKIATISSFILAFNFLFFFFSFKLYTEIPTIFFVLASLYFFIIYREREKKNIYLLLSALFTVLAFLTRYPALLIFLVTNFFLVKDMVEKKTKSIKSFFLFNFFTFMLILPYLIFNFFNYGSFFYFFSAAQNYYKENLGSIYSIFAFKSGPHFLLPKTAWIYIGTIALFFNALVPFLIYGFYRLGKEKKLFKENVMYILLPLAVFLSISSLHS